MLHTHSRIWIHIIWTTKNRQRIIHKDQGIVLFDFLINKAKELGIGFERLNIQPEHIHGLIDLPTDRTVADYMHDIKGSTSHMLNKECYKSRFTWQRGYGAYSVSASKVNQVINYIKNQKEHHRGETFEEEYQRWKREYGIFDDKY